MCRRSSLVLSVLGLTAAAVGFATAGVAAESASSPSAAISASKVWVSNPGTAANSSVSFSAVNTNDFRINNMRSGGFFTCPAGTVRLLGAITVGNIRPPTGTATITSINFPPPSAATKCKFSGLDFSPITATSPSGSSTLPWRLNTAERSVSPAPTNPVGPPVSGQQTDVTITGVRMQITVPSANCTMDVGDGNTSTPGVGQIAGDGSGTSNRVAFVNGNPSTLSILSSKTKASFGVNSLRNGAGEAQLGCAINIYQPGDKFYVSTTSSTSPATFSITPASGGPLWIEGYN